MLLDSVLDSFNSDLIVADSISRAHSRGSTLRLCLLQPLQCENADDSWPLHLGLLVGSRYMQGFESSNIKI
jgi:hypothetical protein